MKKIKKQLGITLMEILVAVSLASLILLASYEIFSLSQELYIRHSNSTELTQNARIALERLTRDIRQTEEIITDIPDVPDDPTNPPPSQLKFQDGHNSTPIRYIEYSLVNNSLYRKITHFYFPDHPEVWVTWNATDGNGNPALESAPDESKVLAENISSLGFWGTSLVTIDLQVSKNDINQNFQTSVLGRNI